MKPRLYYFRHNNIYIYEFEISGILRKTYTVYTPLKIYREILEDKSIDKILMNV